MIWNCKERKPKRCWMTWPPGTSGWCSASSPWYIWQTARNSWIRIRRASCRWQESTCVRWQPWNGSKWMDSIRYCLMASARSMPFVPWPQSLPQCWSLSILRRSCSRAVFIMGRMRWAKICWWQTGGSYWMETLSDWVSAVQERVSQQKKRSWTLPYLRKMTFSF